jgi:hypothetical protein
LGAMTSLMALMMLPGLATRGLAASLPDMVVLALLGALTARVATSWPPVVVEDHFLRLKGTLVEAYRVQCLDVFVPHGRPGAKSCLMRLVFTVTGQAGPGPTEIRVRARVDQARRLLVEARRVLSPASVCDRSGLLEPLLGGLVRADAGQSQSPPPQSGPGPRAPVDLHIRPEHVSTERPRWARDPLSARDARRGARHQERLALAARLVQERTFRVPAIVAEWA